MAKERLSKRDNKRSRHERPGKTFPLRIAEPEKTAETQTKDTDLYSRNYDDIAKDLYQLARLACLESPEDVELFIVRLARKYTRRDPGLGAKLAVLSSYTGSPLKADQ